MTMATNKNLLNCPPLRFPNFSDPWQQITLGDIGKYIRGLTYSSDDVTEGIDVAVMRSNNIQDGKKLNYHTEVVYVSILPTDE